MEKFSGKLIMRKSIFTFLQNYEYYTSTSALVAFPFSASILLSQQAILASSSSFLPTIYDRLNHLFLAAGFPSTSEFFTLLNLKLSQTISCSIFTLPFTLSFFLITKVSVIQALCSRSNHDKPTFSSILNPLLLTYLCNSLVILSANATAFCLLFFSFAIFLQGLISNSPIHFLFFSAGGAVVYSIILANALIICNLALVLSGMERCHGYLAILKACIMIRGRVSTALSLALPGNIALAGIEALFQHRIVRAYHMGEKSTSLLLLASEGMLIVYLYSIILVFDTIVSCIFYKSCCKLVISSCVDIGEEAGSSKYSVIQITEIEGRSIDGEGYALSSLN